MFVPVDWRNSEFDSSAAQCGEFAVPATYSDIIGKDLPDLTIKMLRTPALDQENKLGTLFFNPGGPGESGINVVQTLVIPDEIRARYDLVGFDPRGVGKSSPIKCSDTDSIDYYFKTVSSPEDKAEGDANLDWDKAAVENCAKLNPDWWVMTTLNTVQDMDVMREVVTGDEPFNFVGFSYGTTLAVEYIRAFPEHAGRIVLDSVTSNDDTDYNQAELESTYKALVALFFSFRIFSRRRGILLCKLQNGVMNC
jgi:pimeloyl-ACP methyl ester carboxylesterase